MIVRDSNMLIHKHKTQGTSRKMRNILEYRLYFFFGWHCGGLLGRWGLNWSAGRVAPRRPLESPRRVGSTGGLRVAHRESRVHTRVGFRLGCLVTGGRWGGMRGADIGHRQHFDGQPKLLEQAPHGRRERGPRRDHEPRVAAGLLDGRAAVEASRQADVGLDARRAIRSLSRPPVCFTSIIPNVIRNGAWK